MITDCYSKYGWRHVSTVVQRELGVGPANLFGILISQRELWKSQNKLQLDGSFYQSIQEIAEDLFVTRKTVIKWLKILQQKQLITIYIAKREHRLISNFLIEDKNLEMFLSRRGNV